MCVNAATEEYHIENDCTYTLIHVPNQKRHAKSSKYYFSFKLSEETNICFQLKPVTSLIFSGQFITHRQVCDKRSKK